MVKKLVFFAMAFVLLIQAQLQAMAADLSSFALVDNIYNKPDIIQLVKGDDITGVEVEAYLDDEKLQAEPLQPVSGLNLKNNYLFLVDESTSISDLQIAQVKAALNVAIDNLAQNETITIVTFGETINIAADHSTDKVALKNAVAAIDNSQGGTVFFDVIKKAADICNTTVGERNQVFIISDGADFTVGGHNYEEVEAYVKEYGITVYAIALGTMDNPFISKFGQLARSSGGGIAICTLDTIDDNVLSLMQQVRGYYALVLKSKTNLVPSDNQKLMVKLKNQATNITLEKTVNPVNWIKDTVAPSVTGLEKINDTSLRLSFSEDVLGADKPENYAVVLNDKYELKVDAVTYNKETYKATLVFDTGIYRGTYKISCLNMTDNSMEKNKLQAQKSIECQGNEYGLVEVMTVSENADVYWAMVGVVVLVLIAIAVAAFIIINKRKGLVVHESKVMFRDNLVSKERIITPQTNNISLIITLANGTTQKRDMTIYKSLIVGRSEMCDLSFDDVALSRQHFAIEESNGIYTIMNLSSTNGTLVNGVPLNGKIRLQENDVIVAGNEKFVFKIL